MRKTSNGTLTPEAHGAEVRSDDSVNDFGTLAVKPLECCQWALKIGQGEAEL